MRSLVLSLVGAFVLTLASIGLVLMLASGETRQPSEPQPLTAEHTTAFRHLVAEYCRIPESLLTDPVVDNEHGWASWSAVVGDRVSHPVFITVGTRAGTIVCG